MTSQARIRAAGGIRLAGLLLLLAVVAGGPRATPAEAAGGSDTDTAFPEAAFDSIRNHVVLVSFRFQRDLAGEENDARPPNPRGLAEQYRYYHMSRIVPGFVLGDRRTVVISDPWVSPTAIASLRVRTADGFETGARLKGVLEHVEGTLLETEADLPLDPLSFADASRERPAAFAGSVAEGAGGNEIWMENLDLLRREPLTASGRRGVGKVEPRPSPGIGSSDDPAERTIDLVLDREGAPVGFRFGSTLLADGRWRGAFVQSDAVLPFSRLGELEAAARDSSPLQRLTITFRTTSRHETERNPFDYRGNGTSRKEVWGIAITPEVLVVPATLQEEEVRSILDVRLRPDDATEGTKAAYAGRLLGYRAFFVRVDEGGLTPLPAAAPPPPDMGSALLVERAAWRGGQRRDQFEFDRVSGWGRGYGDEPTLASERGVEAGALLRDASGRPIGFTATEDPEDQERRIGGAARRASPRASFPTVAVLFDRVGMPATLLEHTDTRVMPQEEAAAKRLPWLGVEFDALDEGVAELLGVSGPSRDGARGLVVTVVYPGSPAAKAGLHRDDILLSVRRLSAPGGPPVDLKEGGRQRFFFPGLFGGQDSAPAPWRERSNGLVKLLQEWGVGTKYELTWWRQGKEETTSLEVAQAPPDFSSAPRKFDEASGIEVRDLTYEIRSVLRMQPDQKGVVIGRVEPGAPAAQARLSANEIILELDGRPVADAADFAAMIEKARAAGQPQVRLVVRRLGRTRIVDLTVTAPPAEKASGPEGQEPSSEDHGG